jgi:hypothetical protein
MPVTSLVEGGKCVLAHMDEILVIHNRMSALVVTVALVNDLLVVCAWINSVAQEKVAIISRCRERKGGRDLLEHLVKTLCALEGEGVLVAISFNDE